MIRDGMLWSKCLVDVNEVREVHCSSEKAIDEEVEVGGVSQDFVFDMVVASGSTLTLDAFAFKSHEEGGSSVI